MLWTSSQNTIWRANFYNPVDKIVMSFVRNVFFQDSRIPAHWYFMTFGVLPEFFQTQLLFFAKWDK